MQRQSRNKTMYSTYEKHTTACVQFRKLDDASTEFRWKLIVNVIDKIAGSCNRAAQADKLTNWAVCEIYDVFEEFDWN